MKLNMRRAGRVLLFLGLMASAAFAQEPDRDLATRYVVAVHAAVTQHWNRPDSAQPGMHCVVTITQIPDGEVVSAELGSPCNADPATRKSIRRALMRASPLPYKGYEQVFQRTIHFQFRYDG
jgi:colicin import membrane protein